MNFKILITTAIFLLITCSGLYARKPGRGFFDTKTSGLDKPVGLNSNKKSLKLHITKKKDDLGRYYLIKTPYFKIRSYASKSLSNKTAKVLEETRNDFIEIFDIKDGEKLTASVIVYKNVSDFRKYSTGIASNLKAHAGYYIPAKKTLILYDMDNDKEFLSILTHELTHLFLHFLIEKVPLWLNEGMACYMAASEERYGTLRGGSIDEDKLFIFQFYSKKGKLIPLREIIQTKIYFRGSALQLQYAEYWAIVFFLLHGEKGKYRKKFIEFIYKLIDGKQKLNVLYSDLFGDYDDFFKEWIKYINKLNPNIGKVKKKLKLF
ncbi:DUF1570 domain-containing protein [Chlamydiota bacterium]